MKRTIYLSAAASLLFGFTSASADVDALMKGCNDCHGDGGVSQWADMPSIAGLPEFVLADYLYIYQEEGRPCSDSEYRQGDTSRAATNMCALTADLSEDDIDGLAAAYGAMDWVKASQEFDADLAAAGEAVHAKQCDRCHSEAGTVADDEASMLGGQQMGYLRNAFAEFSSGDRDQPSKMKEKFDALTDEDKEALVNYYGSIQ